MARVIGTPGESAAAEGLLRVVLPFIAYVLVIFPLVIWKVRDAGDDAGLLGVLGAVAVFGVLVWWQRNAIAAAAKLVRDGSHWLKGAYGERLVSQALATLPDEYIVFNDFHPVDPVSGKPAEWNVDHIVIGPTGVFVLDAKYYARAFVPCAKKSQYSARNAKQAHGYAMDLKKKLVRWSDGKLDIFVVAVVVYAQPDARLECLREDNVRTIPLRLLLREIQSHSEAGIDQEKAGRIARVLFLQLGGDLQRAFKAEFDAYGELSKAARYAERDRRLTAQVVPAGEPEQLAPPDACPWCGGGLVRKIARHGERTGKPFLGCSNYRTNGCRYGHNIEE